MLHSENFTMSLSNVPLLETNISVIDGDPLQEVVKSIIHEYKISVVPKRSDFRKCIIHGDFNDLNVLVQPDESGSYRISGIIDFGDMNSGYYIYELAIAIMHIMIHHPEPMEAGGAIIAGWESVLPLNKAEKDCLYVLVLFRFCQLLVFTRRAMRLRPDNAEYFMWPSRNGISFLRELWNTGKERVEEAWFQSAAQFRDRNGH